MRRACANAAPLLREPYDAVARRYLGKPKATTWVRNAQLSPVAETVEQLGLHALGSQGLEVPAKVHPPPPTLPLSLANGDPALKRGAGAQETRRLAREPAGRRGMRRTQNFTSPRYSRMRWWRPCLGISRLACGDRANTFQKALWGERLRLDVKYKVKREACVS